MSHFMQLWDHSHSIVLIHKTMSYVEFGYESSYPFSHFIRLKVFPTFSISKSYLIIIYFKTFYLDTFINVIYPVPDSNRGTIILESYIDPHKMRYSQHTPWFSLESRYNILSNYFRIIN